MTVKLFGIDPIDLHRVDKSPKAEQLITSHRSRSGNTTGSGNYSTVKPRTRNVRSESTFRTLVSYLSDIDIYSSTDPYVFAGSLISRAIRFENQLASKRRRVANDVIPEYVSLENVLDVESIHSDSFFIVAYQLPGESILDQITYPNINVSDYDVELLETANEFEALLHEIIQRVDNGYKETPRVISRRISGFINDLNGEVLVFPTIVPQATPGWNEQEFHARQRDLVYRYLIEGKTKPVDFTKFVNGLVRETLGADSTNLNVKYTAFKKITPSSIINEITSGLIENSNAVLFEGVGT